MGSLRINAVLYEGKNYYYKSPRFNENLIVIEGQNGNGKSTFSQLIYHAFGEWLMNLKRLQKSSIKK